MAETVGRPRAWLMAEAFKQYVAHKEWFTNEVRKTLEAADEGRLINHEDIKAKRETRRVAQMG